MLLPGLILGVLVPLFQLASSQLHPGKPAKYQQLPSLRSQAKIQDRWTKARIAHIPWLLERYEVDVWLMSQREHAEDPVWWSIKNATDFDAHRRTVVLFHNESSSILKDQPNPMVWIDNTGQVWPELNATLEALNPSKIVLNTDRDIAFAGGLHVGELEAMRCGLGEKWIGRAVNEPMLAVEFVASKPNDIFREQLGYYKKMQDIVWAMMEEGFSNKVIEPGVTTTEDLEWWFREKILELKLASWNHPRVSVIDPSGFPGWEGTDSLIDEGDLLHIDWGFTAMGLNTDAQHMAYVLKGGETDAPQGLKDGLKKANRMQDIVLEEMRPGLSGNQVLSRCLERTKVEGIDGQIFSHPIGDWGHDAGSTIGYTNLPIFVPVLGEIPMFRNTYYSIELYAYHFVPERNETLRFRVEEDAFWNDTMYRWEFVRGRQERFHLIGPRKSHFFSNADVQPGLTVQAYT